MGFIKMEIKSLGIGREYQGEEREGVEDLVLSFGFFDIQRLVEQRD